MKVALLLAFCFVGVLFAQTVTNWDLSEVSPDAGVAKHQVKVENDMKIANNQGFISRVSRKNKDLHLDLVAHKERDVRITDADRLLFGFEHLSPSQQANLINSTYSREDVASLCQSTLGEGWEKMVQIPNEDLTQLEVLRLGASMNDFVALRHGGGRSTRRPEDFVCVCHASHHLFHQHPPADPPNMIGTRVLRRVPQTTRSHYRHRHHPVPLPVNRDCLLCFNGAESPQGTDTDPEVDCRTCCYGSCVTNGAGPDQAPFSLPLCDRDIVVRSHDSIFNFYINRVGRCRNPSVFRCLQEVADHCPRSCEGLIGAIQDDSDSSLESCDFCARLVGHSDHFCRNCSQAIDESSAILVCSCDQAFFHLSHSHIVPRNRVFDFTPVDFRPHYPHQNFDAGFNSPFDVDYRRSDSRRYDNDYRGRYDNDYRRNDFDSDYRRNDFDNDYRRNDYNNDYRRSDYDNDYRRSDFDNDYRRSDFDNDYRRNDFDNDYRRNDYNNDYRRSSDFDNDYRRSDFDNDYRRSDFDNDYRRNDNDYRRNDNDYRPHDFDAGFDSFVNPHPRSDNDYRRYDNDYRRSDYDNDYRRSSDFDNDYRRYDNDYRRSDYDNGFDSDFRRNDFDNDYRRYDNDYRRSDFDSDYRRYDNDYRRSDFDSGFDSRFDNDYRGRSDYRNSHAWH